MWFKTLAILLGIFSIAEWQWSSAPSGMGVHVGAFEMDESNETMAEQFREKTSDIDIQTEIRERIQKHFTNPFADSEIDLAEYGEYEGEENSFKITTTHLPLGPTIEEYRREALDKLNEYRKEHCAPPLTMNLWLNTQADTLAQHALMSQMFIPEVVGTRLGENRFAKRYPYGLPPPANKETAVMDAIENWYHERYDYDFENPASRFGSTMNFTNMVWKSTQHFGLGLASNDQELMIVAVFYPPGSNILEAQQNVLRSEHEKANGLETPSDTFKKMMEHSNLYF